MTAKQQVRAVLMELHEMALIEASIAEREDKLRESRVWIEVCRWAEGKALRRTIDLSRTMSERLERQGRIFNHGGTTNQNQNTGEKK